MLVLRGSMPPAKPAVVLSRAKPRRRRLLGAWNAVAVKQRPEKIE
jgi:hypothetical protein